jgi:hypothetical protein
MIWSVGFTETTAMAGYNRALQLMTPTTSIATATCRRGSNRLSLLTYNVLSALKSLALPGPRARRGPSACASAVFTLAGRILTHAGRVVLRVSEDADRLAPA